MIDQEDLEEMTDVEIRIRYSSVINSAIQAFSIDANYAADIVRKAKAVEQRKSKKTS